MKVDFGFAGAGGAGTARVSVAVPGEELADAVATLFPSYLLGTQDRTEVEGPPPELVVRTRPGGFSLEGADRHALRPNAETAETLPDLLALLERALAPRLLELRPDRIPLHAAGVALPEGAVVAIGPGGAGKSSLALAWSAAGLPLLGDDVVLVRADGCVEAFQRLVKVDRSRLEEEGVDPRRTLHWAPGSAELWFDPRSAGGWSALPARGILVAILNRRDEDARAEGAEVPRIRELDPDEALGILLAGVMENGAPPSLQIDALLSLLDTARPVELSYRSTGRAARHLLELARSALPEKR